MPRLLFAALLLIPAAAFAQNPASVDSIYADLARPGHPGCAVAVVRDGEIVHERGYGTAHLEHAVPITPATIFYAGSVSKQFTAAAVARAAGDGRISLDDDVRRWVPELPDFGARITIRHLVHHTSGIRDYLALRGLAGHPPDGVFGDDEVLEILGRQRAPNFPAGERYLYSNSGYWLMGQIIERATGMSLREYGDSVFFKPLGMTQTHFADDHAEVVAGRAQAYELAGARRWRISMPNFDVNGAGGLHTTVGDLAKWDGMFYDTTAATAAFVRGLHQRGVLTSGDTIDYAFGLTVDRYRGLPRVSHGGAYGGYRAHLLRFPDQRLAVLQLCNAANADPGTRALRVAATYLEREFTEPAPRQAAARNTTTPPGPRLTNAQMSDLAGRYTSAELRAEVVISVRGDSLVVRLGGRDVAMQPVGADEFTVPRMGAVRFTRDAAGQVTAFSVGAGRATGIVYEKQSASPIS
ncbi:MAG TPA: serine hydrolase [Gemmatimonadaceae bacterium]|nr:serine hydrolase [Gemmatimonadaceae bacterium]